MLGNAQAHRNMRRKVPQKIYRYIRIVRVKWCGKSAPRYWQQKRQGKPHREQAQIGIVCQGAFANWHCCVPQVLFG